MDKQSKTNTMNPEEYVQLTNAKNIPNIKKTE